MAWVIVRTQTGEQEVELLPRTTIGRHPRCHIFLTDPMISKRHAVIYQTPDGYVFEDTGSSNGSFMAGVRIGKHLFKDGDEIQLGKTRLIFRAETEQEKIARMVNISRISTSSEVQDRIEVPGAEEFLPEGKVSNLDSLRVDYEKLRLGNELMMRIGLERDLTAALKKITQELLRIFPADRCVILLAQPETSKLVPRFVHTASGEDESVSVSESVLREVRETKSALLLADTSQDSRFSEAASLVMQGIRSVMCAPLIHSDEFLGVIHIDGTQAQHAFKRKDLQLFTGIVRHVAMVIANARLLRKIEDDAKNRAQFERLLSPGVVEQIMNGKVKLEQGGELRKVTILFADIRGYTSLSHRSSATDVVMLLNRYFETVVDVVFRYGGTVDKYIGDEIMVLFGAPIEVKNAPDQAVACALEMQAVMEKFNYQRDQNGEEPIHIGIGINSGEVVVGSIGSSQTMQYTCIGDAVNVASRLTGMASPGQIIVSDETMKQLTSKIKAEPLSPVSIKGIEGSLQAYSIKELLEDTSEKDLNKSVII